MEQKVFDLIARRFISVFYPDCEFSTTTVLGEVQSDDVAVQSASRVQEVQKVQKDSIEFKVSGKEILKPGWRVVFKKTSPNPSKGGEGLPEEEGTSHNASEGGEGATEERTLPTFVKGESGPHTPTLTEKWTVPPKFYTEATLLRAMETAGKFVEDETLRAALKENGIGRPSTRAAIIETLFKRRYIKKERKNLIATPTGMELIDLIHEELLKSQFGT